MVTARWAGCPAASAPSRRYSSLTRKAGTVVGEVAALPAGAPVAAQGGSAGRRGALTQGPRVATWALAAEGAGRVEAGATVAAGPARPALVHVAPAAAALEAGWAGAQVAAVGAHGAAGAMGTRAAEAGVWQGAVGACRGTRKGEPRPTTPLPAFSSLPDPPFTSEAPGTAAGKPGGPRHHRALADTTASTGAGMAGVFQLTPFTHPAWWAPADRHDLVGKVRAEQPKTQRRHTRQTRSAQVNKHTHSFIGLGLGLGLGLRLGLVLVLGLG